MKFVLLALLIVILLPFLTQTFLRRLQNNARLKRLHPIFDSVTSSQAAAVNGEVEGRRHGRNAGISFVGAARKPDDKSTVEFWVAASGGVPFQVVGSSGVLFDREFESRSSQPEAFERLQKTEAFSGALTTFKADGVESLVYAGGGRLTAVFRPFRQELITAEKAAHILDQLKQMAASAERA
jgi:hypothetical protein